METIELERLISDLEIAVDRLRSLYEQYFMGIERIEPMVPRKDVERKIHLLRKEQIRNTALRFRFQMILQRYNTYQPHWQRICREIENGTYKRHVARAQRRFGVEATRSRPSSRPPAEATESAGPPAPGPRPGEALPLTLADQLAELDKDFAPAAPVGRPLFGPVPLASRVAAGEFSAPLPPQQGGRPPPAVAPSPAPARGVPTSPVGTSISAPARRVPAPPLGASIPAPARGVPASSPGASIPARTNLGGPAIRRIGTGPSTGATAGAATRTPQQSLTPGPDVAGKSIARVSSQSTGTAAPAASRDLEPMRPRVPTLLGVIPDVPDAPDARAPIDSPRAVSAGIASSEPGVAREPAPRATPARPAPSPALRPQARPAPSGPTAPAKAPGELGEDRVRQLYSEYVETRRRHHESTATVTYEAVARNLRESSARLREKHGKSVDFEVLVRDGKTYLRPILK